MSDLTDEAATYPPENAAAREWVMEDLGYKEAPIVVVNDHNHWSGFRPDKILALKGRS